MIQAVQEKGGYTLAPASYLSRTTPAGTVALPLDPPLQIPRSCSAGEASRPRRSCGCSSTSAPRGSRTAAGTGLRLHQPQDDHIGRAAHLQRCFPTAVRLVSQELMHVVDAGMEESSSATSTS